MTRRRLAIALAISLAVALLAAPAALAAAGGGSAGFGGGGGGGGGGRGVGIYILFQLLFRIALLGHGLGALVLIGLALLYVLFARVSPRFTSPQGSAGRKARRRVAERQRRVHAAAAEAAEDDPAFAPDVVKPAAVSLFKQIQSDWDRGDRRALARHVAPDLFTEWERRLDDLGRRGWHNHVRVLEEPTVEYVALDVTADRVTVRIEAKLRDYVTDSYVNHVKLAGRLTEVVRIREFWTLHKNAHGRWILASIEQGAEGAHALDEPIVATPWSDDERLRDEALIEAAEAVPDGTKIADVADLDYEDDARAAALDLSLADGRFAPHVLEVAARRAAAAWAEAVDGDNTRLSEIAYPQVFDDLLHPGDPSGKTRLVIRGPRVKKIRIAHLDAAAQPATMSIEVVLEGRRYLEDRDTTAVLAGTPSRATTFTEHWTFALGGDARQPWLLASVGAPIEQA